MSVGRCLAIALALAVVASAPARALGADDAAPQGLSEPCANPAPCASPPAANGSLWSSNGAPTLPRGRYEVRLVGHTRYGLAEGVELAAQAFIFLALPNAELKVRLFEHGPFSVALRPRISYPSPFLSLVSREGAGGLLPNTTDVPFALQLEAEGIASYRFARDHLASARLGLAVAPRASSGDLPLLDFPFLYPRFAPLYTGAVPRLALGAEGPIAAGLHYGVDVTGYLLLLDDVDGAYAVEPAAELEYRFSDHVALDAGLRTSIARYPVGTRFHYLPHLDVAVGF